MRSFAVAILAGLAMANPVPQDIDWDTVDALAPIPDSVPDIPVVAIEAAAAQTTVSYVPSAAASSIKSAIAANPTDATPLEKRQTADDNTCNDQCTAPSNDTADSFANNPQWASVAKAATTPSGWNLEFSAALGSSEHVMSYQGYSLLDSYDTSMCASRCAANKGCNSFNIYFERDASITPSNECPNPPSKVVIKCVYWGGFVSAATATNVGQYQGDFHVLIAGSNGYTLSTVATPAGYSNPQNLGAAAINALYDCAKVYTYLTYYLFNSGPFDVTLCSAACSQNSANAYKKVAKSGGTYKGCQFFNTYVLYNNSVAVGQYCALYSESWPASYATNTGQYRGPNKYTIGSSFAYSNTTGGLDQPVGCSNPANP